MVGVKFPVKMFLQTVSPTPTKTIRPHCVVGTHLVALRPQAHVFYILAMPRCRILPTLINRMQKKTFTGPMAEHVLAQ